mgnify:CR=1 FL=1
MTDKRLTEIRVGILVFAAIGAVAGFILLLGDFNFGTVHRIHADFESTGGIRKGATVRMIGVSIGKVTDIGLIRAPSGTDGAVWVRVTAEIPEKEFRLIPAGVTAAVSSQSMLGEKHLELTPPDPVPGSVFKPIAADAVIQGRSSAGLEALSDDASDLLKRLSVFVEGNEESLSGAITEIRGLASRANQFMDANRPKLDETVENLRLTSGALAEGVSNGEIRRVVARADRILKRLDDATTGLETQIPEIVTEINRLTGHADTLVTDVSKFVNDISEPTATAIKDIQTITTDTRAGKGTIGKLVTDSKIFDEFAAFAADIKAHPWKLLFKR